MPIDAYTADVYSIDEDNSHNHIEIKLNQFSKNGESIYCTEALAASIAAQIANILQDRAHERTQDAMEKHAYHRTLKEIRA